jgi:broad specificity phosphatase PhoE
VQVTITLSLDLPEVGEEQAAAHARFQGGVQKVLQSSSGTTLVVTHGDVVAAAVAFVLPNACVYSVKTTGYICIRQESATEHKQVSDVDGVEWLED